MARLGESGLLECALGLDRDGRPRGFTVRELCEVRERLAMHSTEAETAFALQGLGGRPLVTEGTAATIARWALPLVRGESVAAFALSEPEGGSDVARLRLRAEPTTRGRYRLTGVKTWISNAPDADVYTVFARTGGPGSSGITAFAVPGDAPGLTGTPIDMLSPHPIGRLEFDGVEVGPDDVVGAVGGGFAVAMRTLDAFRPSVGAFAIGMAQAALDMAVDYTAQREAFGSPLSQRQAVSHQLADCATRIAAGRALVYQAADHADTYGKADPRLSAMAKLFATETAQRVIDVAIQVHGAVALVAGHRLSHLYRDVRATRIYEGASEIQREIIARSLYAARPGHPTASS